MKTPVVGINSFIGSNNRRGQAYAGRATMAKFVQYLA